MAINKKENRIGEEKYNNQGCLMKIIDYKSYRQVIVEFQDKYKATVKTNYGAFQNGKVSNYMRESIYNIGIVGNIYPTYNKNKQLKEYQMWVGMLGRCYSDRIKEKYSTYKDITCCEEWLYYPNFYEWIHSQENFKNISNDQRWDLDKDIIIKHNNIYSPNNCCIVPHKINSLFIKNNANRNGLPIGVSYRQKEERYEAKVSKYNINGRNYYMSVGMYPTPEDAFYLGYKPYKEAYIKEIAQEEYNKGNITKKCYEAMMKYEVEITD